MDKKTVIVSAVLVSLIALTAVGAATVRANGWGMADSSFISSLASKLGVAEEQVQQALEEIHVEHEQKHEEELEARLNEAVSDGTITDAQMRAIQEKHQEMKANRPDPETFKSMSPEERRLKMQEKKAELEAWAAENNLTLETLHELLGHGKMFFMKHRMGNLDTTSTQ